MSLSLWSRLNMKINNQAFNDGECTIYSTLSIVTISHMRTAKGPDHATAIWPSTSPAVRSLSRRQFDAHNTDVLCCQTCWTRGCSLCIVQAQPEFRDGLFSMLFSNSWPLAEMTCWQAALAKPKSRWLLLMHPLLVLCWYFKQTTVVVVLECLLVMKLHDIIGWRFQDLKVALNLCLCSWNTHWSWHHGRGEPYVQSEDYAKYPFDPPLSPLQQYHNLHKTLTTKEGHWLNSVFSSFQYTLADLVIVLVSL